MFADYLRLVSYLSFFFIKSTIDGILETALKEVSVGVIEMLTGGKLSDPEYVEDIVLLLHNIQVIQIAFIQ